MSGKKEISIEVPGMKRYKQRELKFRRSSCAELCAPKAWLLLVSLRII
jgi:hypothetical protein